MDVKRCVVLAKCEWDLSPKCRKSFNCHRFSNAPPLEDGVAGFLKS